jgi:1-acyl-sn-glycerol-3-phosphate acyltransferase
MKKIILRFTHCFLLKNILKLIVGVQFGNTRFLAHEKQFIIVANHNSHLDTMALMAAIPARIIHNVKPVAAADYFGRTRLQGKLSNFFINTLLIQRKKGDDAKQDPIQVMLDALDKGYSLIIFPEGTRGEPEKMQPFKKGIGLLLKERPHIKYIPAFMKGMGKTMPKGNPLIVPYNSSLKFGQPALAQSSDIEAIVAQVEADILALKADI